MADSNAPGKLAGWTKGLLTSLFGIVSGAAIMYVTPLVNNVIKPSKPVPNFAQQASGLNVTFSNRSTGGVQGWWDFGDGAALEPFEPDKEAISHVYPRPGTYQVKLSLRNLLGEESERVVAVNLDAGQTSPPSIDAFAIIPLNNSTAPATFKIVSQVKNAKFVAWSMGDEPLTRETNVTQEKFVTLYEPGSYRLRLVAFNGDQVAEKSEEVYVTPGDNAKPLATVKVIYDGVQIEQKVERQMVVLEWNPKHQGPTCPVSRDVPVANGWTIADARYEVSGKELRNLKGEVSADRTSVRISGDLVKPRNPLTGKLPAPQAPVRVDLTLTRRSAPVSQLADVVAFELTVPGSTLLPLPPPPRGMEVQAKRIALEIKDGKKVLWNNPGLPTAAQVAVKNKAMRVTATEQAHQLRLDVLEAKTILPVSRPNKPL